MTTPSPSRLPAAILILWCLGCAACTRIWGDDLLPDGNLSVRIGKKAAGRLLDGVEWNEFPTTKRGIELKGE
jgi:hypothetical protein